MQNSPSKKGSSACRGRHPGGPPRSDPQLQAERLSGRPEVAGRLESVGTQSRVETGVRTMVLTAGLDDGETKPKPPLARF
ncbi:hypothetical protein OOK06_39970 [Streptomyces sp. NBC_00340]|uniref:hypothetical protein n=1 Tax=Streptomyces sp. NBC_00340 TaxID=2975716 RepID=UPI00225A82CC|nr:hypothetical protein [Streptomyces sp. NBC_00340]MCX5138246.1 hypothetical protein [Streptomyces sp. NBC_00340]